MQENHEILDCLRNGRPQKKYSPVIRNFSLALKFYSTAAYEFIRSKFNNNLPAVRTLQIWCESVDGSPGISGDALEAIRNCAELYKSEHNGEEMPACLISDEMSLRKDACWRKDKKEFQGFAEYVNSTNRKDEKLPFAYNALVFMIVGKGFKIPVAYYLLAGLDTAVRAALTHEVIVRVNQTGVRIMSLTSDGLPANVSVAVELGADFKNNRPYFTSPTNAKHNIYIIWDAPHLIKIARGRLAETKLYHNGKPLKWDLISLLHNLQKTRNFNLGNKLSGLHIDYKGKKMNVRIAAQTISHEVADGLQQLNDNKESGFDEVDEEIQFLRTIRSLFDIMNYKERPQKKNTHENNVFSFKRPICESTVDEIFSYFDEASKYLSSLEIEVNGIVRKPLLETQSHMTAFGFINNMTSIKGIYKDFVESGIIDKIITFQFSQDHLETWFSCVRQATGSNDNPSPYEFENIFRKLLICHQFVHNGHSSNCKVDESFQVLSVPVSHRSNEAPDISEACAKDIELDCHAALNQPLGYFDQHLNAYSASSVENQILKKIKYATKKECQDCQFVFEENPKVDNDFMKRESLKKYLVQPCQSTVNVIKISNIIIDMLPGETSYYDVQKTIFLSLDIESLFDRSEFSNHKHHVAQSSDATKSITHKEKFIWNIIDTFMNMKSANIGKRILEEERGEYVRHSLRKQTHVAGQ